MIQRHADADEGDNAKPSDPFDNAQLSPLSTRAIESSCWELATLQKHYLPSVSTMAKVFNEVFTRPEYNMEDFLDHGYDTVSRHHDDKQAVLIRSCSQPRLRGESRMRQPFHLPWSREPRSTRSPRARRESEQNLQLSLTTCRSFGHSDPLSKLYHYNGCTTYCIIYHPIQPSKPEKLTMLLRHVCTSTFCEDTTRVSTPSTVLFFHARDLPASNVHLVDIAVVAGPEPALEPVLNLLALAHPAEPG